MRDISTRWFGAWTLAVVGVLGCSKPKGTTDEIDLVSGDASIYGEQSDDGGARNGELDESAQDKTDGAPEGDGDGDDGQPEADAGPIDLHPPSVPTGLRVAREDPCSVASIAWDPASANPEGAPLRGYQLYVDGVHRFTTLTTEQELLLTLYAAGTNYTLTVASYDEDGAVSAQSEPLVYTPATCPYAPEPPRDVLAQVRGCREVALSWDAATQAGPDDAVRMYEVRRDGVLVGSPSWTNYVDFGMTPGVTHRYTINTRSNQALASDPVHLEVSLPACTDTTPPSPPTNLRRGNGGSASCLYMDMVWDASSDDEGVHHYNVYRDGILLETSADTRGQTDIFMAPHVTYRFEVTALDGSGNESERSNPLTFEADCAKREVPLPMRTAVLLGNFPDAADQPFSVAQAEQVVFGAGGSFASYMEEVGFGLIDVSGSVFGWYTLPRSIGSYCKGPGFINCSGHTSDLMTAAASDLRGGSFDRYVRTYAAIGEAGFGGGDGMDLAHWAFDVGTIAHEMGHTLGLMHAGDLECSAGEVTAPNLLDLTEGGCKYSRYGDGHDAMGAGNTAHFSTFNKELLGVLGKDQVAVAAESGTYTLTPAELGGSGIKELRIPLEINGFFYFLEYRRPIGFDATGEGVTPVDGVQVRLHSGGGTSDITTQRLHVLINPGSPFYDRYRKIRVEAMVKSEDAVTVRVTR